MTSEQAMKLLQKEAKKAEKVQKETVNLREDKKGPMSEFVYEVGDGLIKAMGKAYTRLSNEELVTMIRIEGLIWQALKDGLSGRALPD